MADVKLIKLEEIVSPGNPRTDLDEIKSLAESLRENGQLVPIQVYRADGHYFLKFGHRRVAAARSLGWDTIHAVVEEPPANEAELLIAQYNENEQRKGMGYLDRARVFARLRELGQTQKSIATRFGVSDSEVSLALATLRADPKLQKAVEEGRVAPSAIEPLLSQPLDIQAALADRAIAEKTVRRIARLVSAEKARVTSYKQKREDPSPVSDEDDFDPMGEMMSQELKEALEHLRLVEETLRLYPDIQRQVRPSVEELVRKAANLKLYLDGETFKDTGDLI